MTILSAQADPDAFERMLLDPAFAEIESHPQTGTYARSYYPAVYGDGHRDLSFAVLEGGIPVLVVLCSLIEGTLGLHGLPLRLFARSGLATEAHRAAVKLAFAHLDDLAREHNALDVTVRERAAPSLSLIGEAALAREAIAAVSLIAQVDLTAGPAAWRKALRKRFRQFVNWGRANFAISYVNGQDNNPDLFDQVRLFHAEIAGRVTRPRASWDVMYRWLAKGSGELVCARLDGRLVASSMFIDGVDTSLYMNGVYDRSLDKPLAHYLIWHGIERAHARGMRALQLGDIHLHGLVDDKRYGIGYFKRGFATDIETYLTWRWSPARR